MIVLVLRNYGGRWEWWEDDLTAPRLEALLGNLEEWPPLYITVGSFLGVKPKEKALGIDDFIAAFQGGVISLH